MLGSTAPLVAVLVLQIQAVSWQLEVEKETLKTFGSVQIHISKLGCVGCWRGLLMQLVFHSLLKPYEYTQDLIV